MKKIEIKLNMLIKFLFFVFLISQSTLSFAHDANDCMAQLNGKTTFSGSYTVYLSRDSSDPVPFNSTIIYASELLHMQCTPGTNFWFSQTGSAGIATSGQEVYTDYSSNASPSNLISGDATNFGYRWGYEEDNTSDWVVFYPTTRLPVSDNLFRFKFMLTSLKTTVPRNTTLSATGVYPQMQMILSSPSDQSQTSVNMSLNLSIQEILTSCKVQSSNSQNITWSLTPTQISNGEAEEKNAPISVYCGEIETPVKIRVTTSSAISDASNAIIKTSLNNLGLKLTWTSSGQPVAFNTDINDTLLGQKNYDITAKPVQIGTDKVAAGNFAATVTVSIEYR